MCYSQARITVSPWCKGLQFRPFYIESGRIASIRLTTKQLAVSPPKHPRWHFAKLLHRIQPSESELARAKARIGAIRRRLERKFKVSGARLMGSHGRETAVLGFSDVDLLVMLSRDEARWGKGELSSTTLLNNVRAELDQRYVQTKVGRNGQAIVVHFERGNATLDVVPAVFRRFNGAPIYGIPDGSGGWLDTSPLAHNQYFRSSNDASNGRLARLARVIKWWKHSRTPHVPISSFYVDMSLAEASICKQARTYSEYVATALSYLSDNSVKPLADPTGLVGEISASNSDAQSNRCIEVAKISAANARLAVIREGQGGLADATTLWERVFNGRFL